MVTSSISHQTQQRNAIANTLPHVFFIDDNRANNYLIKAHIELDNIPILPYFELCPIRAIEFLEKLDIVHFPDIIFVDINMPLKDGFEFVEDFVTRFSNTKTKIYIMGTLIRPFDEERIKQYGIIKACIEKPINANVLKTLIEKKAI